MAWGFWAYFEFIELSSFSMIRIIQDWSESIRKALQSERIELLPLEEEAETEWAAEAEEEAEAEWEEAEEEAVDWRRRVCNINVWSYGLVEELSSKLIIQLNLWISNCGSRKRSLRSWVRVEGGMAISKERCWLVKVKNNSKRHQVLVNAIISSQSVMTRREWVKEGRREE
jgi:hypothetical protein